MTQRLLLVSGPHCNIEIPVCSVPLGFYGVLGNQEIERQLKKDRAEAKRQVNILLLGAGESGKVSGYSWLANRWACRLVPASETSIVEYRSC